MPVTWSPSPPAHPPTAGPGLLRHLYVDICPPALQNPEIASVPAVAPMRPAAAQLAVAEAPAWLDALPDLPLVYVTLGTVYNRDLDVFRTVIEGLRDQPVSVVVTVGRQNDPSALGPQPANVAVHQYIPAVLDRPDFVEAAPTLPGDSRIRLPPTSSHRYDGGTT